MQRSLGGATSDFGAIADNADTATGKVTLKAMGAPGTTIENTAHIARVTNVQYSYQALGSASDNWSNGNFTVGLSYRF